MPGGVKHWGHSLGLVLNGGPFAAGIDPPSRDAGSAVGAGKGGGPAYQKLGHLGIMLLDMAWGQPDCRNSSVHECMGCRRRPGRGTEIAQTVRRRCVKTVEQEGLEAHARHAGAVSLHACHACGGSLGACAPCMRGQSQCMRAMLGSLRAPAAMHGRT